MSQTGHTSTRNGDLLVSSLCSGLAMLLATVATARGVGLTQDSVGYLSTGINVARSNGLRMLADQPLTIFPPGLPLIAAFGEAIGIGAEATLRVVSIGSFGAIVALGNRLLRQVATHRGVIVGSTLLLAISPALLGVSMMAWSEPPFIVITLLFLLVLSRVWARRTLTGRDAAALCALCWLAFLLRYIGLSLVAVSGITLLYVLRPLDWRTLRRIMGFGILTTLVPIVCMLRNQAADGTILGNRLESHDSLRDVGVRTAATIGGWVIPTSGVATRHLALVGAAATLLVVWGFALALRQGGRLSGPGSYPSDAAAAHLLCCALFTVIYVAYLTGAALSTAFEPTNSRYLSPIYVPLVVVAAVGVERRLTTTSGFGWRRLVGLVLVSFVAVQFGTSILDARDGAAAGIGFNAKGWTESDLARAASDLVEATPGSVVYSNHPNALWAATRMQPIQFAPRDEAFRGVPAHGELDLFVQRIACSSATNYLVIYLLGDDRVISVAEMKQAVDMRRVAAADDGVVFRVTSESQQACTGAQPQATRPG